ncbi:MAG: VapC toxin family PIN domain ribonuclease [Anaerolinea sp.]|nr:VapC toxin family PIN domain ribonuclease [Anaerolinea sp.]
MTSFVPDTSVLVPALQRWHQNHVSARTELRRRLDDGEHMLLAGHSLMECYSVLTRLPPPLRLAPRVVTELIQVSYVAKGAVVTLSADQYADLLAELAASGIAGGRTYDAVIAATARAAGADVILTFNVRDFAGIADDMEVRAPASIP